MGATTEAPGPALRLRRAASRRLPVLDGGHADPLDDFGPERLDDRALDAWTAACADLAASGLTPVLPRAVAAALARRRS